MTRILLFDDTMKAVKDGKGPSLSFREKIELARILDRLGVDGVETGSVEMTRTDGLLIKSLAAALDRAVLSVSVPILPEGGASFVNSCLGEAKKARFQVEVPVSTVQMEYLLHRKPDAVIDLIKTRVAECAALGKDTEFLAKDAGRSDLGFLKKAVDAAIESGASTVTVSDAAGTLLPDEVESFVRELSLYVSGRAKLGILLSDGLHLSVASAVNSLKAGAEELKVSVLPGYGVSLEHLSSILSERGETLNVFSGIRTTELRRTMEQIGRLLNREEKKTTPFENGVRDDQNLLLNENDDLSALRTATSRLGYDLSDEDASKVFEAFGQVVKKKGSINAKELDALIATNAMQVPPAYRLESYLVNAGNVISSSSHVRLKTGNEVKDGLSMGDGPIDASFLAIEQITGIHYELDDFQIRAVTEGREAMGETVVRLRSDGKLYSGRGISTDIVGSSIQAYINALNKIVYEEGHQ